MTNISSVLHTDALGPARPRTERSRVGALGAAAPMVIVSALAMVVHLQATSVVPEIRALAVTGLAGIAVAALRWSPEPGAAAWRALSMPWAIATALVATALVGARWIPGVDPVDLLGPATTSAIVATYLVTWGFRSQPLLRTMAALSVLAWPAIASTLHDVVWATMQTPSEVIYRRLAELRIFDIAEEPWRLFTAELHRGALVVIATVVLCSVGSRRRASLATIVELLLTVAAAVIVHHAVILESPLDRYARAGSAPIAAQPVYELATAALAAVSLAVVRQVWRPAVSAPAGETVDADVDDRDPVIFAVDDARRPVAVALTLVGLAPIVALSMAT